MDQGFEFPVRFCKDCFDEVTDDEYVHYKIATSNIYANKCGSRKSQAKFFQSKQQMVHVRLAANTKTLISCNKDLSITVCF